MFNKKTSSKMKDSAAASAMPRILEGVVVSDKMQKTRVVAITRTKKHPVYAKFFSTTKRYKAHDENNEYHTGDVVRMRQCRPISKDKKWEIITLVEKKKAGVENTMEDIQL